MKSSRVLEKVPYLTILSPNSIETEIPTLIQSVQDLNITFSLFSPCYACDPISIHGDALSHLLWVHREKQKMYVPDLKNRAR